MKQFNIAGKIPGMSNEKVKYVEDFVKLSTVQLEELLERQDKLLSNKSRLSKLPDKGQRIQDFHDKLTKELASRNKINEAANLFSELNIASTGHKAMNSMEWNGKIQPVKDEVMLDSDDDEDEVDPLKVLARSMNVKTVKIIKPEKNLITEDDLQEIKSFVIERDKEDEIKKIIGTNNYVSSSTDLDAHAIYLCDSENLGKTGKSMYKPYKTTKTNVHDPEKEKVRRKHKYWEITAATPPLIVHNGVKMLSLHESIVVQRDSKDSLKKILEVQAGERLIEKNKRLADRGIVEGIVVPEKTSGKMFQSHRAHKEIVSDDSDDEEEENDEDLEVYDDDDEKAGGVNYSVVD